MYRRPKGALFYSASAKTRLCLDVTFLTPSWRAALITIYCPPLSGGKSPELHRHRDVQQFVNGSRPITSGSNSR
jgi:hypothetical protein